MRKGKTSSSRPPGFASLRLKPSLVGFGFVFAWAIAISYLPPHISAFDADHTNTLILVVRCLAYIAFAFGYRKMTGLVTDIRTVRAVSLAGAAATFLGLMGVPWETAHVLVVALIGLSQAFLTLSWFAIYGQMDFRHIAIYYSAANIVASLLPFLLLLISQRFVAIVVLCAMPLAGCMAYERGVKTVREQLEPLEDAAPDLKWSLPIRPMLLMAGIAFVTAFTRCFQTDFGVNLSLSGQILSSAAVLAVVLFFHKNFDFKVLYLLSLPLAIFGLSVSQYGSGALNVISAICTNASLSFFVLFAITLLCSIAYRYNVNPLWLLGFAEAMKILGSVLGLVVGTEVATDAAPVDSRLFTDVLIVALVVLFMIFLSDKDYRGTWGSVPVNAEEPPTTGTHGQSYFEALLDACAHIAHQYGLTRREEEVVFLLAQNKSLQSIESELCITTGTAKSHCHHIYTKIGIHKRQELIDLIANDKAMKAARRSAQVGR